MTGQASDGAHHPIVVLVGNPGSGKTTAGKALAKLLDVPFRDTDRDVEAETGTSVSDIFIQKGEQQFRALERAAVQTAIAEHHGVLALGGGAVLDPETREQLRRESVVYLKVGLAAAMQRLHMNRSRPLLVGNVRGRWQQLANDREPLYLEVATFTVDTDHRTTQEVAHDIAAHLASDFDPKPDQE
ncbi:MAG: shikimate kinase [Actinomycetes bacterium]